MDKSLIYSIYTEVLLSKFLLAPPAAGNELALRIITGIESPDDGNKNSLRLRMGDISNILNVCQVFPTHDL